MYCAAKVLGCPKPGIIHTGRPEERVVPSWSPQSGVLSFSLLEEGDVGVGVLPEGEEILVASARLDEAIGSSAALLPGFSRLLPAFLANPDRGT